VFLAGLHRAERIIAERLVKLANGKLPWAWIDPDKALSWVERRIGFVLAESQVAAIRLALVRALRVDIRARRQGDANSKRLRQGGLQRRHRIR
jgi:hypothetical protein